MGVLSRNSYVRQRTRRVFKVPDPVVGLAEFDRRVLERLTTNGASETLAKRARIILSIATDGTTNAMVSRETGASLRVVTLWKRRFFEHGLIGLVTAEGSAPDVTHQRASRRYGKIFDALDDAMQWAARRAA